MSEDPFGACTTPDELVRALKTTGTKNVHVGVFDADAILREKTVGLKKAEKLIRDGYRLSDVIYEWDIGERTFSGGAFADEAAEIDPTSGRIYPFAQNSAWVLADFTGPHADISPRNLARTQVQRAESMGYGVRAAFEYEFFVFEETPDSLREKDYRNLRSFAPGNWSYSALTPACENEFLSGLLETIRTAGIEVDAFHTELGPGCLEAPLFAREGLRAPDDAAMFKTIAKAYALKHGKMATFMAKWSNRWPGQSAHLHLSLFRLDSGEPVFGGLGDGKSPDPAMRAFLGGLLSHLPELLVMCAHTVNAYRRMVPDAWAPTFAGWGIENRSCAARAILRPSESARIEFRVPAADSNPYLAFAACLGAGLTGIEHKIEPPPPVEGNAYRGTIARECRFPRNLLEAAERFRASRKARELFGDRFVDWFARAREWEDEVFRRHVSDLDVRRYFEAV